MKKVLFITPQNPEKIDAGDKKYSWDILRALKYKDDTYIHVISFFEEYEKGLCYEKLDRLVDRITYVPFKRMKPFQMTLSKYPASIAHRKTKLMEHTIKEILEQESFDVIIVNMFRMSYLISTIKNYTGAKVYVSHNVEYQVTKSIYQHSNNIINKVAYCLDYFKTRFWERRFLMQYDVVTTICDNDAEMLKTIKGIDRLSVIRPIVDVTPFDNLHEHTHKLIICGSFRWLPKKINIQNVLRCNNVKLLKSTNTHLLVVGDADECVVNEGNSIENVSVTGYVDSVVPYYQESEVALIPEQSGGGFKLKIAEAVQHNIPIVAIKGSVTDNEMKANVHFIEAEDFDDLILKGIQLCDNRKKQKELVVKASEAFSKYYSIETVHNELAKTIYCSIPNSLQ